MKKRYLLVGLLTLMMVLALVAVACGGTGEEVTTTVVGSSTGPIKVGHIFDETGNEAIVGSLFQQAVAYVFDGAVVQGRPIELIEVDAKSTTEGAVEAARKLVEQDKVDVIFGPTQSGQKTAVASYCLEKQVPMVLYNPTPPGALEENEWVIGAGGLNPQYGTAIADYMYTDLGYKTLSTLGADDTGGRVFFDSIVEYFTAKGGEVVQQQWAVGQTDDWSAYLTTVDRNADALCAWVGGSGIPMLTAYYDTGLYKDIPLVGAFHGGFLDPWIPKNMAEAGNVEAAKNTVGIETVMAWNPDSTDPVNLEFIEGFNAYGAWKAEDAGPTGAVQAGMMLLAALENCATNLSNVTLRDSFLQVDIVGPEGRAYFAEGDNVATKPMYIVVVAEQDPASHPDDPRLLFEYDLLKTYEDVPPHGLEP